MPMRYSRKWERIWYRKMTRERARRIPFGRRIQLLASRGYNHRRFDAQCREGMPSDD